LGASPQPVESLSALSSGPEPAEDFQVARFDEDHIWPPYLVMPFQLTPEHQSPIIILDKKGTLMNRKDKRKRAMLRGAGFLTLVLFSATILSGCAHRVSSVKEPVTNTGTPNSPAQDQEPGQQASAEEMIADFLLFRPLGIVTTALGTAVFVASLPFTVPAGNTKAAFQKLVIGPAKYTFYRPLGKLEDH